MTWRSIAAEAAGTFALVAVGCGAIMADALGGGLGTLGIALAFGGIVALLALLLGPLSGAHLNPAVTLALVAAGRFPARRAPLYIGAQIFGALLAAFALLAALGPIAALGATVPRPGLGIAAVLAIEAFATLLLAGAVLAPLRGPVAALAPGLAVFVDALVAGPLTMASMNPARSLGPALVSGEVSGLWMYLLAPVAGALLAALLARGCGWAGPQPAPREEAA